MHLLSSGLWSGHSRWLFSRLTRACFTYTLLTCLRTHPTPASDCSYQKDGGGACPSASFPGNGWANLRLISTLTGHLPVTPGAKAAPCPATIHSRWWSAAPGPCFKPVSSSSPLTALLLPLGCFFSLKTGQVPALQAWRVYPSSWVLLSQPCILYLW